MEEREWMDDTEAEWHMRFMGKKLRKVKEFWTNLEAEVRKTKTKMNKSLEELRVALVWFVTEEISDVIIQDLMVKFSKIREKEERLGEVLTLRMQDKKEVTAVIEKI